VSEADAEPRRSAVRPGRPSRPATRPPTPHPAPRS